MDPRSAAITRAQIIAALHAALEARPEVLAASLGGSDATGRTDEFSDVDLVVVVEEGAVESTFAILHSALEELSPITHRWRLADPTWHGNAQEFLTLRDADPAHFIDVVVLEPSGGERFLEIERHGTPIVLFDRVGSSPRHRWIGSPSRPGSTRAWRSCASGSRCSRRWSPGRCAAGSSPRRRWPIRTTPTGRSSSCCASDTTLIASTSAPATSTATCRRTLRAEVEALALPGLAGRGRGVPEPGTGPVRRDAGGARQSGVTRPPEASRGRSARTVGTRRIRAPAGPAPWRRRPRRCWP